MHRLRMLSTAYLAALLIFFNFVILDAVNPDTGSTGLNVGSAITPAIFGWIMDRGDPQIVFWLAALFMFGALGTVVAAKATR